MSEEKDPTLSEQLFEYAQNIKNTQAFFKYQMDEGHPLTEIIISFGANSIVIKPATKEIREHYTEAIEKVLSSMDKEADVYFAKSKLEKDKEDAIQKEKEAAQQKEQETSQISDNANLN